MQGTLKLNQDVNPTQLHTEGKERARVREKEKETEIYLS